VFESPCSSLLLAESFLIGKIKPKLLARKLTQEKGVSMKLLALLVPALMVSSMAFAQDAAAPAAKMTAKMAKKECKAEGMKGKALKKCVKEKLGK
jgi:hypothetical protein